jgi:predicted Zn-dependent protease with MMP-like domain
MSTVPRKQKELEKIASREIRELISRLPSKLRARLDAVAVVLEFRPDSARIAGSVESDTLGLFVGPSLPDGDDGAPLPPRIILFLENIRDEARESGRGYREELRRTFLHELGHYLGLEEDDLALRDVD